MQNFVFYNPAKIIFGKGMEEKVGEEVSKYSVKKRVLFHYGGGSIKKNGVYDKVVQALKNNGIYFVELGGVVPNPRITKIYEGIQLCKENDLDFILAVGGGSVIDSAKGIAAGVKANGDIWDYYMEHADISEALPIGVVLTIPAAGSESSNGSVVTNEEGAFKRDINSEHLIPKFAIMNPETNYSLPAYQTACGAADIIAHLMERYFAPETNVDFTDRLIEGAIQTVMNYAPLALEEPGNYDYRAELMWAGTIAHNSLLNTGRTGDWASHKMEHELSGIYDIAHGAGLTIIFPAWMKYVYHENIDKFVQFGTRILGVNYAANEKERIVKETIYRMESFYQRIGLPIRLSEAGIGSEHIEEMAEKAVMQNPTIGAFKKLGKEDIVNVLNLAL